MKDKLVLIAFALILISGLTIPLAVTMNWGNGFLFACSMGGVVGLLLYIFGGKERF